MTRIRFAAIITFGILSLPIHASQAFVSLCCEAAGSISRIQNGKILNTFAAPAGSVWMATGPGGKRIYTVTSANLDLGIPGTSNELYTLATDGTIISQIALPFSVWQFVVNSAGTRVYATSQSTTGTSSRLLSVNLVTGQMASVGIPGPKVAYSLAASPDGQTVFVFFGGAVMKFNTSPLSLATTIAVPASGFAPPVVTPDGKTVIVVGDLGPVCFIDVASNAVTTLPIPTAFEITGQALSPDGKTLYANGPNVFVIEVLSQSLKATIPGGLWGQMAVSPDGTTVYASSQGSFVETIDANANTVTSTVGIPAPPYGLGFDAMGRLLVLTPGASATVQVDTGSLQTIRPFPAGDNPMKILLAPTGTAVVANQGAESLTTVSPLGTVAQIGIGLFPNSLTYLNGLIYAGDSHGRLVSIDPVTLRQMGYQIPTYQQGLNITAMDVSPTSPLLYGVYSNAVFGPPTAGGIVEYAPGSTSATYFGTGTFVGNAIAVNQDASIAYTVGGPLSQPPLNTVAAFNINNPSLTQVVFPNANFVDVKLSPDGSKLYVLDSNGMLDILNPTTLTMSGYVAVGLTPTSLALSLDGSQAIVTDSAQPKVSVVDLVNLVVVGTIQVGRPSAGAGYVN